MKRRKIHVLPHWAISSKPLTSRFSLSSLDDRRDHPPSCISRKFTNCSFPFPQYPTYNQVLSILLLKYLSNLSPPYVSASPSIRVSQPQNYRHFWLDNHLLWGIALYIIGSFSIIPEDASNSAHPWPCLVPKTKMSQTLANIPREWDSPAVGITAFSQPTFISCPVHCSSLPGRLPAPTVLCSIPKPNLHDCFVRSASCFSRFVLPRTAPYSHFAAPGRTGRPSVPRMGHPLSSLQPLPGRFFPRLL